MFHAKWADNSVDLLRMLVRAGVDLEARDKDGHTALISYLDLDNAQASIALGVDVFARDTWGQTALEERLDLGGSPELVSLLRKAMEAKPYKGDWHFAALSPKW